MKIPYAIQELSCFDRAAENEILLILEKSLRASHTFFHDCDTEIRARKARAKEDLRRLVLVCATVNGEIKGFSGIFGKDLKMLYVHPEWQGKGMGRGLIEYSIQKYNIQYIDVYADNAQAVGFYRHMGFICCETTSKSDSKGNILPILRMKLAQHE